MADELIQGRSVSNVHRPGVLNQYGPIKPSERINVAVDQIRLKRRIPSALPFGKNRIIRNASSGKKMTTSSSVIERLPQNRSPAATPPSPAPPTPRSFECSRIAAA